MMWSKMDHAGLENVLCICENVLMYLKKIDIPFVTLVQIQVAINLGIIKIK